VELISRSDWGRVAAQRIAEDRGFYWRFYPLFTAQLKRRERRVQAQRQAMKMTARGTDGQ
jgi:hypothetical protein